MCETHVDVHYVFGEMLFTQLTELYVTYSGINQFNGLTAKTNRYFLALYRRKL